MFGMEELFCFMPSLDTGAFASTDFFFFFFSSALKYSVLIVMQPPVKKAVNVWPQ